ncbi:conserved hypothetical protein [Culex quinquefasciatus]|uniref:Uncharacterized protein n=1 Tax=Culex quinquefasciatus TaxID=7176 RepID=B0WWY6_CULQU|nr:conserved hypothetical protein [Culex quinquefasciatus]|eukprot:XP_001861908.1 conserved hypothetical protein [Culex quinquefasciatus]
MSIFKLRAYPFVCRLCLKPEQHRKMTSLDTEDECFEGGTLEDFLAKITFQVEEEKRHLFPRSVCPQCKELLQMFGRFRTKVRHLHLFMNALVELRDFNTAPIRELCRTKLGMVRTMLAELDLCHTVDFFAQDLIDEFPHCKIAKLPATMVQSCPGEIVQIKVEDEEPLGVEEFNALDKPEEDDFFADECSPEELAELTKEIVADENVENVASEEIMQDDVEQEQDPAQVDVEQEQEPDPDVRWECFDDSDEEIEFPNKPTKRELRALKASERKKSMEKGDMWDLLNENEPAVELTLERVGDLDAALANRKYGTAKAKEPLQCPKCPYTTIFKSNFYSHQLTHLRRENKTYPCKEPDFHNKASLECEHCSRMFYTRSTLVDHIESVHKIRMRFVCDVCVASFNSQDELATHKARHDNPKHLQCGLCLIVFPGQEQMQDHMCITYREDYDCCDRDWRYHVHYNRHMFLKHSVKINARVKPDPHLLVGEMRAKRKPVQSCSKCKIILPSRTKKKQHQETCKAGEL